MLQLILGRSGSGKTRQIYDELTSSVGRGNGKAHILLVPEQFSFESERALLERLGASEAGKVQVLSFTRLAETVFRELGGLAGRRMDDCVRALLLSQEITLSSTAVIFRIRLTSALCCRCSPNANSVPSRRECWRKPPKPFRNPPCGAKRRSCP